jgi:hypothetical protein
VLSEVTTAPLFLRLGARLRGPAGTTIGALRRITIRDVVAEDVLADYAATIAGLPGHPIEDVSLTNVRLTYRGGRVAESAARRPPDLADAYPEPSMFGPTPAYGLWARYVAGLRLDGVEIGASLPDGRPPVLLQDVDGVRLSRVQLACAPGAEAVVAEDVENLSREAIVARPFPAAPRA